MFRKRGPKSEFNRNVITLLTGTAIAQAIPIASSPILTRLYTPSDFGVFALFMSVSAIISVICTGRYELAIILPANDNEAFNITAFSCLLVALVTFILFVLVFLFNNQFSLWLGNKEIAKWLYLIPISVLSTGLYQNFNYWCNRKKRYKNLARARVTQASGVAVSSILLSFVKFIKQGLIVGGLLGNIASTYYLGLLIWKYDKEELRRIRKRRMLFVARKYKKFPQYDVLASLSNVASQQCSNIFFNVVHGAVSAGYYFFTNKMMSVPVTMIATAIQDVFKEKASYEYNKFGHAKYIYIKTLKKLVVLSIIPTLVIFFFAEKIFVIFFGPEWRVAGQYARILTPMLFFRFISSPLSFMLYIGGKQQLNLLGNLLMFSFTCLSFWLGNSPYETVVYLSISTTFIYILYIYMSAKIAKVI